MRALEAGDHLVHGQIARAVLHLYGLAPVSAARPRGSKGFEGEIVEGLMHPLRPCFDICNDAPDKLHECHLFRNVEAVERCYCVALRGVGRTQPAQVLANEADAGNRSRTKALSVRLGLHQVQELLATRQNIMRAARVLSDRHRGGERKRRA